jgi:hypothetical protein
MAKVPTMAGYSPGTGTINTARLTNGTDYAINSIGALKGGFATVNMATMAAVVAGAALRLNYTADTGW